ncbi:MAG: hypothetical protein IJ716_11220 [Lachnospiraceae bacterium]|nr:hypothetical protein [Lachnospiraceae bacterium]
MEEIGMTNEQYKGMLLDELEDWQEVLEYAKEAQNEKIVRRVQNQLEKIRKKMTF